MTHKQARPLARTGIGSRFVGPPIRWAWAVALTASAVAALSGGADSMARGQVTETLRLTRGALDGDVAQPRHPHPVARVHESSGDAPG